MQNAFIKAFVLILALVVCSSEAWPWMTEAVPEIQLFIQAASLEEEEADAALAKISELWRDG